MGLSVHIQAQLPAAATHDDVRGLVERWQARAQAMVDEGRLERAHEICDELAVLKPFATKWVILAHPTDPDTVTGAEVSPVEGWIFVVEVGEGCEPLALGLCRYPAEVKNPFGAGRLETGKGAGWTFSSTCKTHYGSLHGWEHFRRCHLAVIDLALAGEELGMEIRITDEGDYWPGRDEEALKAAIDRLNGITAAFAGGLKDALDDEIEGENGPLSAVRAAIFEHPGFELLEAEAQAGGDAEKIAEAIRRLKQETDDGKAGE